MVDKNDNDGDGGSGASGYVTRAECARTSDHIFEELSKHGLALYGEDGRGGIQKDVAKMSLNLASIEKSLKSKENAVVISSELSTRRLVAYIVAGAGIIGPVVLVLVQAVLRHIDLL